MDLAPRSLSLCALRLHCTRMHYLQADNVSPFPHGAPGTFGVACSGGLALHQYVCSDVSDERQSV